MRVFTASITSMLLFGLASAAPAQVGSADLERVRGALLQQVRITNDAGERTTGVLQSADAEVFTIQTLERTVAAPAHTVRRIERRGDSLKNGFIIGAVSGVAYAGVMGAIFGHDEGSGAIAVSVAVGAALGGLIGAGIDALHDGWTTVYKRAPSAADR